MGDLDRDTPDNVPQSLINGVYPIYTTDYGHSNVLLSVNHFTVAYELPLAVESDTGLIGT